VFHIGVDARLRPSTRFDGRRRAWCEWALRQYCSVYKSLKGLAPQYLADDCKSSTKILLCMPSAKIVIHLSLQELKHDLVTETVPSCPLLTPAPKPIYWTDQYCHGLNTRPFIYIFFFLASETAHSTLQICSKKVENKHTQTKILKLKQEFFKNIKAIRNISSLHKIRQNNATDHCLTCCSQISCDDIL